MTAAVMVATERPTDEIGIAREDRWLHVRFDRPHRCLGWTIVGGGLRSASGVSWRQVDESELTPPLDSRSVIEQAASAAGLAPGTPIFVTGCDLDEPQIVRCTADDVTVDCVATVGLGNALRAGDPPGSAERAGTINVLCRVSRSLTDEALVEALSIAIEARSATVLEARFASRRSGRPATGTGTDCVVVAAPTAEAAPREARPPEPIAYAGKHTALGHAIGAAVGDALGRGIAIWLARNDPAGVGRV